MRNRMVWTGRTPLVLARFPESLRPMDRFTAALQHASALLPEHVRWDRKPVRTPAAEACAAPFLEARHRAKHLALSDAVPTRNVLRRCAEIIDYQPTPAHAAPPAANGAGEEEASRSCSSVKCRQAFQQRAMRSAAHIRRSHCATPSMVRSRLALLPVEQSGLSPRRTLVPNPVT